MSTLSRYKKSGGFLQLLQLLETCGPQKRQTLMATIDSEDTQWTQSLQTKMITIEKVLTWSPDVLAEIAARLQPLTLAVFTHNLNDTTREKVLSTFSHGERRRIEEMFETNHPSPGELQAAQFKVIEEARTMIQKKQLRDDSIAHEFYVIEGIEETLTSKPATPAPSAAPAHQPAPARAAAPTTPAHSEDSSNLLSIVKRLQKENEQLKAELKAANEKLGQIKKLA